MSQSRRYMHRSIVLLALLLGVASLPGMPAIHAQDTEASGDVENLIKILESDSPVFDKAIACRSLSLVGDERAVATLANLLNDPELATYARSALELIEDETANQALLDATEELENEMLVGVIVSLGIRRDSQSLDRLVKLLDEGEGDKVRNAAARALGHLGTKEAAEALRGRLPTVEASQKTAVAWACLDAANGLAGDSESSEAASLIRDVILADLGRESPISLSAMRMAIKRGLTDDEALIKSLLASEDQVIFRAGVQAAREVGPSSTGSLVDAYRESTPTRQVLLLLVLTDVNFEGALPTVLKAAAHEDTRVRIQALKSLSKYPEPEVVETLLNAMGDEDESIAEVATESLVAQTNDTVRTEIAKLLTTEDPRLLRLAIEASAKLQLQDQFLVLLQLTQHSDREISTAAISALGQTSSMENFDALLGFALANPANENVARALEVAAARLPREEVAAQMSQAFDENDSLTQVMILGQLTKLGGPRALSTVAKAALADEDSIQDKATQCLGEWPTSDVAEVIFDLYENVDNNRYKVRMLRGYIRAARQLEMTLEERMEVCQNALSVAEREQERALVLAVLRRHPSLEGLQLAVSQMNDAKTSTNALSTAIAIADSTEPDAPYETSATLQRAKKLAQDDQAREAIQAYCQDLDSRVSTAEVEEGFAKLFDGESFEGWHGGDMEQFRIENGAIIAGTMKQPIAQNEFLRTDQNYGDFELRLQFKLIGESPNAGVQIRTQEITDDHEVSGYQADLGPGWWGCLYDESRRRKVLAGPPADQRGTPVWENEWNEYRILCEGKRIRLWINGYLTVDFLEEDDDIPLNGIIAVQVHSGEPMEAHYRNIRLREIK